MSLEMSSVKSADKAIAARPRPFLINSPRFDRLLYNSDVLSDKQNISTYGHLGRQMQAASSYPVQHPLIILITLLNFDCRQSLSSSVRCILHTEAMVGSVEALCHKFTEFISSRYDLL